MRTDLSRIQSIAQDFANSSRAQLWQFVTDDVRHALVDAAVMDCIRTADALGNQRALTPIEIIEFRAALVALMRTGIPSRLGRRFFRFSEDLHPGLAPIGGEGTP